MKQASGNTQVKEFPARSGRFVSLLVLSLMGAAVFAWVGTARAQEAGAGKFNRKGNILIADQFNNRVIEIDPRGNIVYQFGDGSSTAGPTSIVAPNDAERIAGGKTLIAATGAPAGAEETCADGCPDNRVLLVSKSGKILWQYGQAGVTGSGDNQLNAPVQATYLPNGHVLITDQGNHRVIEVKRDYSIVWQYGTTEVPGSGPNLLNDPNSAELLDNGDILISDEGNNRVIEVSRDKAVMWSYGTADGPSPLSAPAFASRLPSGNTLVSDGGNNRIVEVDPTGQEVWQYVTSQRPGSVEAPAPSRAVRLKSGNTLISDQFNDQVIEVDPSSSVVFMYGSIGVAGRTVGELDAPYDAKVIGDYTGLTKPPKPQSGGMSGGGGGGYGY